MERHWIFVGAILAAVGVALGAWGAHGLEGFLTEKHGSDVETLAKRLDNWRTATSYLMFHAIGLIALGLIGQHRQNGWLKTAGWLFVAGISLFSGMLFVLVLTEIRVLGAIVPLGGISYIAGWLCMASGSRCFEKRTVNLEGDAPSTGKESSRPLVSR